MKFQVQNFLRLLRPSTLKNVVPWWVNLVALPASIRNCYQHLNLGYFFLETPLLPLLTNIMFLLTGTTHSHNDASHT